MPQLTAILSLAVLPTAYQTPAALHRTCTNHLPDWLKNARSAPTGSSQPPPSRPAMPARPFPERSRRGRGCQAAREVVVLDEEIVETDALIEGRFRDHPHAESS
jgi:hypothetical protein